MPTVSEPEILPHDTKIDSHLRSQRRRVIFAVAGTILVWGFAFVAIRIAVHGGYGPGELALARSVLASIVLGIYAAATRMKLPAIRDLPGIFLLGLTGFSFYNASLNFGELTVPAGIAGLLIATIPIFTALLAVTFLKEHLGTRGWIGVLVAFAGVVLIVAGQQKSWSVSGGVVLILLSAISAAGYFTLQRPFLKRYTSLELTTFSIWAGAVLLMVFCRRLPGQVRAASWGVTAAVVYLGVFPTAAGYVMWNYAMSKLPLSRGSTYLFLMPVVALLSGIFLLKEIPTWLSLCGGPVAICGVFLVNTRKKIKR
jgi:drug/metabolite transporter (DMT)-like permease